MTTVYGSGVPGRSWAVQLVKQIIGGTVRLTIHVNYCRGQKPYHFKNV